MAKRYFQDLREGEYLNCQPVVMSQEAIVEFASKV
jgi:hypothetical protein